MLEAGNRFEEDIIFLLSNCSVLLVMVAVAVSITTGCESKE